MKPEISFGPPQAAVDRDGWPHVMYAVTLRHAVTGVTVATSYRMGVGHFRALPDRAVGITRLTTEMETVHETRRRNPHATLKNPLLRAKYARACARHWRTLPDAADVLHALCMDAAGAHGAGFEEWAAELGYDSDSRRAESTYNACRQTWRDLRAVGMTTNEIETLAQEER